MKARLVFCENGMTTVHEFDLSGPLTSDDIDKIVKKIQNFMLLIEGKAVAAPRALKKKRPGKFLQNAKRLCFLKTYFGR